MTIRIVGAFALLACLAPPRPVGAQGDAPRDVGVALLMADLSAVDGASQSFDADVFMLATWTDASLADPAAEELRTMQVDDVWHPTLVMYNLRSATRPFPDEVGVRRDGTVTYLQRYVGEFSDRMDLRDFPLDRQEFVVTVAAAVNVGANVTLTPDLSMGVLRTEEFSVSDWKIGEARLTGGELALGEGTRPSVTLSVPAERRVNYFVIQVLIPLIAIVMMAYSVFWVAPDVVPVRVGVVVTTMLTLIAYRFMLANHVPRLSYLTRLDWFMLGATVLVSLALGAMATTSYLIRHEKHELVEKIDRVAQIAYPLVFVIYSLAVILS